MGTLSKTVFETVADRLQKRIEPMITTYHEYGLKDNTEEGLAAYIDEAIIADPELQAYLTATAVAVDRQVLRENVYSYLHGALGDPAWGNFIKAINGWVKSVPGGEYDDFASWLNTVGGSVPPLLGEVIMQTLGGSAFDYAGAPIGIMHPYMDTVAFDKVFTGTMGVLDALTDDTTDAASVAAADVAFFVADDDVLVLGLRSKFNYLLGQLSTVASEDAVMTIKYWNGSAWAAVAGKVDNTTGMSVNDVLITWTMPTDWVPSNFDSQTPGIGLNDASEEEMYYVIIQRTSNAMVTPPVATWFQTIPQAVEAPNGELWGGIAQPPLALAHITGVNTAITIPIQDAEHERFVVPGTGNSEIKLKAISAFAANITYTLKYVDQDGSAAQSHAQAAWTAAIAAGDVHNVAIDGSDTGVRSIDSGGTIVTANTTGVFAIIVNAYSRALGAK